MDTEFIGSRLIDYCKADCEFFSEFEEGCAKQNGFENIKELKLLTFADLTLRDEDFGWGYVHRSIETDLE